MSIWVFNKFILVIASLFSLFGFSNSDMDEMDKDEKIADKVSFKTVCKLEKKYELKFVGMGLGDRGHSKLAHMSIKFKISHPLQMDEARRMIVDCVEEYLSDINSSEELRPYILNSHFTFENVGVGLYFYETNSNLTHITSPYIGIVSLSNGVIRYFLYEKESKYKKEVIREPYEEAFAKVKGESY